MKSIDHYLQENIKSDRLIKDKSGRNIMTKFAALKPKTYCYLMDDGKNVKKAKGTKKCVMKKYVNLTIIKIAYETMKSD